MKDFFSLALKNLRRRKLRSWLTMIGIFIGIAAVVSLISLGQGLQTAITGQFETLSTDILTIQNAGTGFGPPGSTVIEKLNEHDVAVIEGIKGVSHVITRLLRVVKVEYNKIIGFKYMASIPENPEKYQLVYDSTRLETQQGRLLKQGDKGKVVLGSNFADKNRNGFDKEISVGKKIKINGEEFEVVGILQSSSTFTINDAIFMFEEDMKDLLEIGDEIDLIIVQVENPKIAEETAARIEKALRKDRNLKEGEEDFSVETPLQTLGAVNDILNIINVVVAGIAAISLLVGGIGIANTMYTSVLERTKEIGIMKAVGARNSDVLKLFLVESGLLGLVGGIIGALIGASLSYGISAAANLAFGGTIIQPHFPLVLIISAILFSFFIGVFSGLIPAIQASKLKPVDALRK